MDESVDMEVIPPEKLVCRHRMYSIFMLVSKGILTLQVIRLMVEEYLQMLMEHKEEEEPQMSVWWEQIGIISIV